MGIFRAAHRWGGVKRPQQKWLPQVFLKKKVFWNKDYDVIVSVVDFTNKVLWSDWNYIVDVFMWPKFGNCSTSMTEVITISIL